jgi:ubiquinone biosynthesis protein COQ9
MGVAIGVALAHSASMQNPASQDWATVAQARLLDAAIGLAPEVGWNGRLIRRISHAVGLSDPDVELLLPKGASDLSALLSRRHDSQALAALGGIDASKLKVRERIHAAVEARIEAAMAEEAAVRASGAYLARPGRLPLALQLGWESADGLWRWAGDESTDENHYSKRAILAAILATTLAVRMAVGHEQARKHLSNRIDLVMAFETWKAKRAPRPSAWGKAAAQALGRLRYGDRSTEPPPTAP